MENERLSLEIQQEAEWQAELNQMFIIIIISMFYCFWIIIKIIRAEDMEMDIAEVEKLFSSISLSVVEGLILKIS